MAPPTAHLSGLHSGPFEGRTRVTRRWKAEVEFGEVLCNCWLVAKLSLFITAAIFFFLVESPQFYFFVNYFRLSFSDLCLLLNEPSGRGQSDSVHLWQCGSVCHILLMTAAAALWSKHIEERCARFCPVLFIMETLIVCDCFGKLYVHLPLQAT